MLLQYECLPCILSATVRALRLNAKKQEEIAYILNDIVQPQLFNQDLWKKTSPELISALLQSLNDHLKVNDLFYSLKKEQINKSIDLYPQLKKIVQEANDQLYMAVKLAIIGNSFDIMKYQSTFDAQELIFEKLAYPISDSEYVSLKSILKDSSNLAYMADNVGELIFDKLLLEVIKKDYDQEVYYIVRSSPTLTDACPEEALEAGIQEWATIVENGIQSPLPGTILDRCSRQVRNIMDRADLIISKGGGNFDTLSEEKSLNKQLYFMLVSKCDPYARYFNTGKDDLVLTSQRF